MGKDLLLGVSARRFPYVRCKSCGLIFLSERPTREAISLFYPENYHPYSEPALGESGGERRMSTLERFLEFVDVGVLRRIREVLTRSMERRFPDPVIPAMQAFYKPPHRGALLLDFGCGSTFILNRLRETRWTTIGMDFLDHLVEQVRREGHRGILASDEGWKEIADESIDAVRMNHVLEHLYETTNVLSQLHRKLKVGGRIHIAVPNPDGLSARLFRSRWFSLEAPRHLRLYSPKGLADLLAGLGFVDVRILHERTPKDFSRSLGYLLQNRWLLPSEVVQGMANEPLLNEWLAPLTCLAGGLGYGDRIHAFARKGDLTSESSAPR